MPLATLVKCHDCGQMGSASFPLQFSKNLKWKFYNKIQFLFSFHSHSHSHSPTHTLTQLRVLLVTLVLQDQFTAMFRPLATNVVVIQIRSLKLAALWQDIGTPCDVIASHVGRQSIQQCEYSNCFYITYSPCNCIHMNIRYQIVSQCLYKLLIIVATCFGHNS